MSAERQSTGSSGSTSVENNASAVFGVSPSSFQAGLNAELDQRRTAGRYRQRRKLQSAQGVRVRVRGRELVNFASNNYLNLAGDPRLARAVAQVARRYGCGAGASPLVSGYLPPERALERTLARWQQTESALVFSSGFVANLALVSTLAGREDAIFSDALNHASLIDGCRLGRARIHIYRHRDADHLHDLLRRQGKHARRRLIVTDTVFSMDGDLAPLAELGDLAKRHDCLLLFDDAHATGVLGEQGRGLADLLPMASGPGSDRLVKVGTLSKALGSQGGFVCGSRLLIDWFVNHARPYIFSTALAPPAAAAARRAVGIVQSEPERRRHLLQLAETLRARLQQLGYPETGSRSQIVPIVIGDDRATMQLSARLEDEGLLVPGIRPPSVPEGTARLRVSLTAGHTEQDIDRLVTALRKQ